MLIMAMLPSNPQGRRFDPRRTTPPYPETGYRPHPGLRPDRTPPTAGTLTGRRSIRAGGPLHVTQEETVRGRHRSLTNPTLFPETYGFRDS